MQSLPDGQTRSAGTLRVEGEPVIRPALGVGRLQSADPLRPHQLEITIHMQRGLPTHVHRSATPLQPDAVTFNTILRQATTQRYESLARAVLITKQAGRPSAMLMSWGVPRSISIAGQQDARQHEISSFGLSSSARNRLCCSTLANESRRIRPIIEQIDTAIAQADSYRLVSLLQYVTASGSSCDAFDTSLVMLASKELVMRIYPALNTRRHLFRLSTAEAQDPLHQNAQQQQTSGRKFRPKANQASRHAILSPHVLTAHAQLGSQGRKDWFGTASLASAQATSIQSALQSLPTMSQGRPGRSLSKLLPSSCRFLLPKHQECPKFDRTFTVAAAASIASAAGSHGQKRDVAQTGRSSGVRSRLEHCRLTPWSFLCQEARLDWQSAQQRWRIGRRAQVESCTMWQSASMLSWFHHWQLSRTLSGWRRKRVEGWMKTGKAQGEISALGRGMLARVGRKR